MKMESTIKACRKCQNSGMNKADGYCGCNVGKALAAVCKSSEVSPAARALFVTAVKAVATSVAIYGVGARFAGLYEALAEEQGG